VIQIIDICKSYRNGDRVTAVLDHAHFEITDGKALALVGKSGTGKSTLLNLLGGIDTPDSGEIVFDGQHLEKLNDQELSAFRNRTIGFVFQQFHLSPERTSIDNIMLPLLISGYAVKQAREIALTKLCEVGLEEFAFRKSKDLSGGQRQRVAIARALVNSPKLLLCDEPSGALDPETSREIYQLLFQQSSLYRTTIVIVSHDTILGEYKIPRFTIENGKIIPIQERKETEAQYV